MKQRASITHDAMFRTGFAQPGVIEAVVWPELPPEVTALFAGPPELVDGKFLGRHFAGSETDLVVRVPLVTGPGDFVYLPLEHKSKDERLAAFQLGGYQMELYGRYGGRQRRRLPWVIPVIIYCGKREWRAPLSIADSIPGDHAVAAYARRCAPSQTVRLVDLAKLRLPALEWHPLAWVACAVLRGAMRPAERERLLPGVVGRLPDDSAFATQVIGFIVDRWEVGEAELLAVAQQEKPERGGALVTSAKVAWLEEGKAEGKAEGRAEAMMATLTKLMQRRFGKAADDWQGRIQAASAEELDAWILAVLDAPSPEAVFSQPRL